MEETRAVVLAAILDLDDAQIHALDRGEALLHLGVRRIRLPRALGHRLRAGAIDDEHGRVRSFSRFSMTRRGFASAMREPQSRARARPRRAAVP